MGTRVLQRVWRNRLLVGLLHAAVLICGVATLRMCGWLEPDPDYFRSLMHHSAAVGNTSEMRWAVRICPSALAVMKNAHSGFLPIHTAVECHQLESVRELVRLGSSLDAAASNGSTPLYLACDQGDTPIAEFLIEKGAKLDSANGCNPLHAAAYRGDIIVVRLLLAHGADVNLTNRAGTALHMAVASKRTQVVRMLIVKGVDTQKHDCDGLTAIDRAVWEDNPRMADLLIQMGARRTLIFDISRGDLDAVAAHLRKQPDVMKNGLGQNSAPPLHYAASFGQLPMCQYLLQHGADRAARDNVGMIAVHRACQQQNSDVLRAVCTPELVNSQCDYGDTPLHFCAEGNNVELGRILISEYHADLNRCARNGVTPLLCAFRRGHSAFCKLLIENNAEVNVAEEDTHHTPLHFALFNPWQPVLAEMLLQHGANPYAKGVGDETPWDRAQRREDTRKLFERYLKK